MKNRNLKHEIPSFAEAPALRKASGGGASRRQAKYETNRGNKNKHIMFGKFRLQSSKNILTKSPLTPLCQRGELIIIPLWKRGNKGDFNIGFNKPLNSLTVMFAAQSSNNFSHNWGKTFGFRGCFGFRYSNFEFLN